MRPQEPIIVANSKTGRGDKKDHYPEYLEWKIKKSTNIKFKSMIKTNQEYQEMLKKERETNENQLFNALRQTRYEPGTSIEEVAKIISLTFDETEHKSLIDELVKIYEGRYGKRLFK